MADGYGFGGEGDWKTAALVRAMKVMAAGPRRAARRSWRTTPTTSTRSGATGARRPHAGGLPDDRRAASRRSRSIRSASAARPTRCAWSSTRAPGPAVNAARHRHGQPLPHGRRTRSTWCAPDAPLPKLPVARALWVPQPDLKTAAAAWIHAGGAHHTGFSLAITPEHLRDFAEMAGVEFVLIDERHDASTSSRRSCAGTRPTTLMAKGTRASHGARLHDRPRLRHELGPRRGRRLRGRASSSARTSSTILRASRACCSTPSDPHLARQNPADYIEGLRASVTGALAEAERSPASRAGGVIGIGVDTTGSTPMPVDAREPAAGARPEVEGQPRGPGLALEGPHRRRRGGGDHARRRARTPRSTSRRSAASTRPSGSGRRSGAA